MEEEKISPESVRSLSRVLLFVMFVMTTKLSYDLFTSGQAFRAMFTGMNLQLPLASRLLLSPVSSFAPLLVFCVAFFKNQTSPNQPFTALKWNVGAFVVLVVFWELLIMAVLGPIVQLVGNLG